MIISRITLIRVLCCLGCFSQTFHLTKVYFSYPVQSEVTFYYPKVISLPHIDIAIPIASVLNMTAILDLYPRLIPILCYETRIQEDLNFNGTGDDRKCQHLRRTRLLLSSIMDKILTVGDIEKHSFDPISMIHKIYYRDFKSSLPIGKDEMCQISKYFSAHRVYLRISCFNDSQPITAYKHNLLLNGNFLVLIAHSFNFPFEIRLAAPKQYTSSIKTRSGFYNPIDVNPGQFARAFVNFRQTTVHLLDPPYQTNCRHYSRFRSYDLCLKELYLAARYPNGSSAATLHPASLYKFGIYPSNLRFFGLDEESQNLIRSKCHRAVQQQQCNTIEYNLKVKTFIDDVGPDGGMIVISPSTEPDILFDSYSFLEKSEYITFTGSILGFWFGLSVSNRLLWFLNLFIRFKNRNKVSNVSAPNAKTDKVLFYRRTSYNSKCYREAWNPKPEN